MRERFGRKQVVVGLASVAVACAAAVGAAALAPSNAPADGVSPKALKQLSARERSLARGLNQLQKALKAERVRVRNLDNTVGPVGPAGATGPQGPQGQVGIVGPQGSARAYAHVVIAGGAPTLERSFGFTAVRRTTQADGTTVINGEYCLAAAGLSPGTSPAVVTQAPAPTAAFVSNVDVFVGTGGAHFGYRACEPGEFQVVTEVAGAGRGDVSFTIVVP